MKSYDVVVRVWTTQYEETADQIKRQIAYAMHGQVLMFEVSSVKEHVDET